MELNVRSLLNAPLCDCQSISVKMLVKKETKNKGRSFYKCEKSACEFFAWEDDTQVNSDNIKPVKEHKSPLAREVLSADFYKHVDIHWVLPMYSSKAIQEIKKVFDSKSVKYEETNLMMKVRLGYDFMLNDDYTVQVITSSSLWRNYNHLNGHYQVPSNIRDAINTVFLEKYKLREIVQKPLKEDGFWILKNTLGCHFKSPLDRKEVDYLLFYKGPSNIFICQKKNIIEALQIETMMQNDTCIYISDHMVRSVDVYSEILNKSKK